MAILTWIVAAILAIIFMIRLAQSYFQKEPGFIMFELYFGLITTVVIGCGIGALFYTVAGLI